MRIRTSAALAAGTVAGGIASAIGRNRLRSRRSVLDEAASMDRPSQVWMINHYANPPSIAGGTRHHELASLLKRDGWMTTVFAAAYSHFSASPERPVSLIKPVTHLVEDGVDFVWLYTVPYQDNNWRRYANMVSFLVTTLWAGVARPGPDVVIGSSPHLFGALGAFIVARVRRVPFILEVRDLWPESLVQLGLSNRFIIRSLEFLEKYLYGRADHIIALTEGIVCGIRRKGIESGKITLVSNAALRPEALDAERREATRERLGWKSDFVVIWIGAHGPANGLDVLVEAARAMRSQPGMRFVLVGEGSAKPALMSAADDLTNIEFLDAVPKAQVQELLRAADIGVIVHRNTQAVKGARPNKLFDYMAAGLPILLNLDGEARRLVEGAGAGMYVESENPQAIVDGVCQLMSDDRLRLTMSEGGFAMARAAYSREDTAEELADLLDRVTHRAAKEAYA